MKLTDLFSSKNLSNKEIGDLGEELAVRRMKHSGYKILERNFSVPRVGELDVIAMDGEYLCFVEVRFRKSSDFGTPAETVGVEKQRRIVRTAQVYAAQKGLDNVPMRFDVVEVYGGRTPRVEIIKDAFWS